MRRTFVPLERVAAVLIHEAVTTTGVYFYLALALRDGAALALPFGSLRPRLAQLLPPYRAAHAAVFGDAPPPSWPEQADASAVPRLPDTLWPAAA